MAKSSRRHYFFSQKALRLAAISLLSFFALSALVLWQQTRLPDFTAWFGGLTRGGREFRLPLGVDCVFQSTTILGKSVPEKAFKDRPVVDRAYAFECTWAVTEDLQFRVTTDYGHLEISYCSFIPASSTVCQTRYDWQVVEFWSGYTGEMLHRKYLSHELIDGDSYNPSLVLVAKSVRAHLLIVALICGGYPIICFVRGPFRRWRRLRRGSCAKCGYKLTGLTEPRCPECGTRFGPPIAQSPPRG